MNTKHQSPIRVSALIAGFVLAALSSYANAASSWNFSSCNSSSLTDVNQVGGANFGNSWNCAATSGDANSVNVSAWGKLSSTDNFFAPGFVSQQGGSGFGISSQSEGLNPGQPDHAADNSNTNAPDVFVLKFTTSVALSAITTGWVSGDSDMTVMAFNSAPNISSKTATSLAGWSLLEDAASNGSVGTRTVNGSNTVSSWWLISAYSSNYGGGSSLGTTGDYFKLLAVASKNVTTPPGVPEPGSLALLGAAVFGFVATRRRQQASA